MSGIYGRHFDDDGRLVFDPDDPLAPVKEAVKSAGSSEQVPGNVVAAIEAMATYGMDKATFATVRAYLKSEKLLPVSQFDSIVKDAERAARRARRHISPPAHPSAEPAHLHTPPDWASEQDILKLAVRKLRVCTGLVGEDRNAKLVYLALTSRLLDKQVSVVVKGLSSSGKSYAIECTLWLFPDEAAYTMTAMSEKALIYLDEDLAHRTIVLYEATALREGREKAEDNQTAYIVRSLLSEGRIEYPVTIKDEDGSLKTVKLVKEGPTNLVTSTTSISLHPENETRMLSLSSNDSQAQTRAVMLGAADDISPPPDQPEDWIAYQRWLAASANRRAAIPFARCIAAQIPPVAVRLRRDWNTIRALIKTHAIMHQRNRQTDDRGRVIATVDDYLAIRSLVNDLVADGIGATVPETVRETVRIVDELGKGEDAHMATVAEVARALKIERSAATRRLQTALKAGYIANYEEKRGRPALYGRTSEPMPGDLVVLPAQVCTGECEHLSDTESAGQKCDCTGVCRCALPAEGGMGETYISPSDDAHDEPLAPPPAATQEQPAEHSPADQGACERHAGTGFGPHPQCLACNPVAPDKAPVADPPCRSSEPTQNGQHAEAEVPPPKPAVSDLVVALTGQSDPPLPRGVVRSPFAPSTA